LWHTARLFNLRHSSDAPNLQVENEETIEALSARAKALLVFYPTALFIFASDIHVSVRMRAMRDAGPPRAVPVPSHRAVFLALFPSRFFGAAIRRFLRSASFRFARRWGGEKDGERPAFSISLAAPRTGFLDRRNGADRYFIR
jgi:hypothetical protein